MYTPRDFLGFFLGAAIAAALVVLLLPCGGVVPALQVGGPNTKTLQTAAANGQTDDNLAELLRSAASEDNTVIVVFTNEAWTAPGSLLDIFLESFRVGVKTRPLLKHLVVVAVDAKAFQLCQHVHPLCYSLAVPGVHENFTKAQSFLSKDYMEMVWVRNEFQGRIVELGHNVLFTDVDIVWFRNPLLRIPVGADITVSCDKFYGDSPYDLKKSANTGFIHVKASARTSAFFRDWHESRSRCPPCHDQDVFTMVKDELAARHGVTLQFVDTAYLGCQCEPKMDFRNLCTFHANCIIGLDNKMEKLLYVLDQWKQFRTQQELLGSNSTVLVN